MSVSAPLSRVLVTGGAGFIGHRLVRLLVERGLIVGVVDNLSSGLPMPGQAARLEIFDCDIRDEGTLQSVFRSLRPDAVVHLAAVHHIPTCERERAYALDVNITGTERVLAAAEQNGVRRFLLASSGAVYDVADSALDEDSPLAAHDNYALCKMTNERQVAFWARRTTSSVRVARIFNAVGPDDPNAHLLPDLIAQIRASRDGVIRLGNTSPRRDYVWVEDIAEGVLTILLPELDSAYEVFNVCSGVEHSVSDIVAMAGALLGLQFRIETDMERVRAVDRSSQLGSPRKTREHLGWSASVPFEEALNHVLREAQLLR